MSQEFYIGWEAKAAPGVGRFVRLIAVGLLLVMGMLAMVLAVSQHATSASVFEWGTIKQFSGVLETQPYPHLLVPRPGVAGVHPDFSTYYLVAPFKFDLDPKLLGKFDGENISLRGTLIYRGNQTMVETLPDSIKVADKPLPAVHAGRISLGRQTLVGEIVDSKCFLGVMNPGQLLPHRECAIRCISGGIPPILWVSQKKGPPIYLLLVSAEGKPVNQQVLDLVAEPVQITGEVEREGDLLILQADPKSYQCLKD